MVKQENIDEVWKNVVKMLETMKYGSITLVVQDGKVVQLEKNEKVRIR
ncbi:YezD family protein [Bacillus songklensis]|uniref:YezD family protein n=1 Tax=Bacillus songklensis TaxID=1069116 RepID=A0ABV8BBT2_9BACI